MRPAGDDPFGGLPSNTLSHKRPVTKSEVGRKILAGFIVVIGALVVAGGFLAALAVNDPAIQDVVARGMYVVGAAIITGGFAVYQWRPRRPK